MIGAFLTSDMLQRFVDNSEVWCGCPTGRAAESQADDGTGDAKKGRLNPHSANAQQIDGLIPQHWRHGRVLLAFKARVRQSS
jgi:hypothetical protein